MAYDARTFRILIASPSDVEEEREIAVSVIQRWNDLNSYPRKLALLPLRWETHTAPEYGIRPQEVINRAIVDECDLLVGIFWTRIGSPTGVADSGTLEEIERAANAGKPVMLYFSKVKVEPEHIDSSQLEKLRDFKTKTYKKALVETYRTIIEFRDKFTSQLELKVRELQAADPSGHISLALELLSIEKLEPVGNAVSHEYEHFDVSDLTEVPVEKRAAVKELVDSAVKQKSYLPVALAINNSSPSGVRNVYVELEFSATSTDIELTASPERTGQWANIFWTDPSESPGGKIFEAVESKLSKFQENTLQRTDSGWTLSFEWEALQPQRVRLVKPVLVVYSPTSSKLSITAKVFADSFPKPLVLQASISINAVQKNVDLKTLLPEWNELLQAKEAERRRTNIFTMGNILGSTKPA